MPRQRRSSISVTVELYDRIQQAAMARGIKGSTLVELACADPEAPPISRMTFDDAMTLVRKRYATATCHAQQTRCRMTFSIFRGKQKQTDEVPLGSGQTRAEAWKAAAMHQEIQEARGVKA